jgi:hypothetical protein
MKGLVSEVDSLIQKRGQIVHGHPAPNVNHREELLKKHNANGLMQQVAQEDTSKVADNTQQHLNNFERVDMLKKGDWKGMQQEAARLHEQSKQHQVHILNAKLASQYKSGKAKIWQDVAQGKPGAFDRARQFIHTPKEYREKAIAIAKNPDPSGEIDIESFRKNKLREAAMKTGDKDLLEDVSRGYKADAAIYGVVSHVLKKNSVNLKNEQNDWLKAVDEAKKKQDAEKKRVSKGWLELESFPKPQFKVGNVDVKMQPMIKRGVYEKPSYSKYSTKYHTRKEEALAAAEAVKGQAFRYPPEADEATRRRVIHEKPNGPLLYQADRLARKTENNGRKMYAVLFRGADRSKAEAARAKELNIKHQEEGRVHGIKATRSKVLQQVWEHQTRENVEKIPNLLEKLTSSHVYVHEADHFHRKALEHGRKLAEFVEEEQDTHPRALMHAEKKRFNLLRGTALMSGDKSLAQDVALRYVVKNAAHRDLVEKAKMKKQLYEKKARDWIHIANEKQLEIEFDERLKHDQDERKNKEAMAKKKQVVEKEETTLNKRSTEMEVPLLNKEAESPRAKEDKQKGNWRPRSHVATSSYKAFLRRAKNALAQRPQFSIHEDFEIKAGRGKEELNNKHQLDKMLARRKDTIDSEGEKPKTKGSDTEAKRKRRLRHPYQTPGGRGPNMSYYRRGGFSSYTRAQDNDSKDLLHDKILLLSSNVEAQKLKSPPKGSLMARLMEVSGRKYRYKGYSH